MPNMCSVLVQTVGDWEHSVVRAQRMPLSPEAFTVHRTLTSQALFYKNIVTPAKAEHSYFSVEFKGENTLANAPR